MLKLGHSPARRGSAMTMMVLIAVILTALVMTIAWAGAIQTQNTASSMRTDQAFSAAESASQAALWQFKHNNMWRQNTVPGTLPTFTIGSNTYSYALTCKDAGATADLYWPFDEGNGLTTADTSGHGNTGTLIGGVSWTTGHFVNALHFDGVSGYVDAGNNSSTNVTGAMTMAAWIKLDTAAQDQKVGGNQDGVSGGYKMSIYGLKVEFETRDASNTAWLNRAVAGGTIFTIGTWYHVVGIFDPTNGLIKTYVNGNLDRSLTGIPATALTSTAGNFRMGREPWNVGANTRYFAGTIDDVRIYKRVLSDQEIKTLSDTSARIHVDTKLVTPAYPYPPVNAVDFIASVPTPVPPIAPALTVGGNLAFNKLTVSGDVSVLGNITATAASSVNGLVKYGGTYTDISHYITITYQGKSGAAQYNSALAVPTIDYTNLQNLATAIPSNGGIGTSGTGKTYTFTYQDGYVNVIYVNGNVTDPVIDTSQTQGTLYINGNLTLTKSATFGSSGFPAYIVVKGSVSHTGGTITLNGGLYMSGSWTHKDWTINGDVVVGTSVTDTPTNGTTIVVGGIPWFDPRSNTTAPVLPLYFTNYLGLTP